MVRCYGLGVWVMDYGNDLGFGVSREGLGLVLGLGLGLGLELWLGVRLQLTATVAALEELLKKELFYDVPL